MMISKKFFYFAWLHREQVAKKLAELNLFIGQDLFLMLLHECEELSQKEITEKLQVEYPTVTKMTSRLVQRGFVLKKSHTTDLRVSMVSLTDKGRAVCATLQAIWRESEQQLTHRLTPEEVKHLSELLNKLK